MERKGRDNNDAGSVVVYFIFNTQMGETKMIELTTEERGVILEMLNKNAFPGSMASNISVLIEKVENYTASEIGSEKELNFDGITDDTAE